MVSLYQVEETEEKIIREQLYSLITKKNKTEEDWKTIHELWDRQKELEQEEQESTKNPQTE